MKEFVKSRLGMLLSLLNLEVSKIEIDDDARFVRIGFGKCAGRWFAVVDCWGVSYMIARK